ncbi:pilus assembly protein [Sphingomicrobium sp. GRR-S6-50]|uniref:Pilus assembly protein n=2 Tax=Sphingomicrobium sediminis TaxID=2950949 RepID=A0A9X2EI39_9SPHN|nr:pilus assembly protein [Sphingomicrobium sediminis]
MALVIPLLLLLMFGSLELGNYFYSGHRLTESVREGARYAARQGFSNFPCGSATNATVVTDTQNIVRKGEPDTNAVDLLPNWGASGASITVSHACVTAAGGQNMEGLYRNNTGGAPVVTVRARVPYQGLVGALLGFGELNLFLNADQQAAVVGL